MVDNLCLRQNFLGRLKATLTVDVHLALPHRGQRSAAGQAKLVRDPLV